MAITRADVEHVAHLARLGLTEAELERLQEQLNHILGAMEALGSLDTAHIPPTAQVIPLTSIMREDAPRPSLPVDEALRNAPRRNGDSIEVPPVLE
jgi:aspartyl-tRNA(Asn)/glutamyl-tRNA(Gln) amidotransferase subunit C